MRYHAADVGQEVIGYVAENLVLQLALLRHLSRPGRPSVFQYPVRAASGLLWTCMLAHLGFPGADLTDGSKAGHSAPKLSTEGLYLSLSLHGIS